MMAKRLATLLTGLGAGLFPALSFGLGLGDLQIDSRLNQPLRARIEIADVSDEEWRQIRANVAPQTLLTEVGLHPELLGSISMKAVEAANHRHFIEVRSQDPLTEPLFDLPVEVAGQSGHVVRNFSVMLDPASTADAPQLAAAPALVEAASAPPAAEKIKQETMTAAPVVRHRGGGRHRARTHRVASNTETLNAPRAVVPTPAVAGAPAAGNMPAASQQQLENQLNTLQLTLAKMQETVKAQDAEIAKLTAQIAASSAQSSRPQTVVIRPQAVTESSGRSVGDARNSDGLVQFKRSTVYWGVGVALAAVLAAIALTSLIRRRREQRGALARELVLKESAAEQPRSNVLAWQNSLRAAQSGSWKSPAATAARKKEAPSNIDVTESGAFESGTFAMSSVADSSPSLSQTFDVGPRSGGDTESIEAPGFEESQLPDEAVVETKPVSTRAKPPLPVESMALDDAAIAELTEDLEAELANMRATEESARVQKLNLAETAEVEKPGDTVEIESRDTVEVESQTGEHSEGAEAWRAQTAMLEQAYLADDTEALPFVLETGNRARAIADEHEDDVVAKKGDDSEAESDRELQDLSDTLADMDMDMDMDMETGDPASTMEQATMTARSANGDLSDPELVGNADVVKILEQSSDYEPGQLAPPLKFRRRGGR